LFPFQLLCVYLFFFTKNKKKFVEKIIFEKQLYIYPLGQVTIGPNNSLFSRS